MRGIYSLVVLLGMACFSLPVFAVEINTTTTVDDITVNGNCTLREAIQAANTNAAVDDCVAGSAFEPDVVRLLQGEYVLSVAGNNEDANATGDLDITQAVNIRGAAAAATIVDADGLDRIFDILNPVFVEISGVTLRGGDAGAAGAGGAVRMSANSDLEITESELSDNRAGNFGGAIVNVGGSLDIVRCLLTNNSAGQYGGAVSSYVGSAFLQILSSTLSGNSVDSGAGNGGGAIEIAAGSVTINNSTITENTAEGLAEGGGIDVNGGVFVGVRNSVIAGNTATTGPDCTDGAGTLSSNGYLFIGDTTDCTGYLSSGTDQTGTGAAPLDPLIGELADNGGLTRTHAVLAGSPLIDLGSTAVLDSGGDSCEALDQRGLDRGNDGDGAGGGRCDIGAVEYYTVHTASFVSRKRQDGFIVESSDSSQLGGRAVSDRTIKLGDLANNRSVLSVLSFNTESIPDSAVILTADIKLRRQRVRGDDPTLTHGNFILSYDNGVYGTSARLQAADFEDGGTRGSAGRVEEDLSVPGLFVGTIAPNLRDDFNLTGITQFKIYFSYYDDNDNVRDLLIFRGDAARRSQRPTLELSWIEP